MKNRDLEAIRSFYESFRNDGLSGTERYCDLVYKVAGVRYAIMTNIPFDVVGFMIWCHFRLYF